MVLFAVNSLIINALCEILRFLRALNSANVYIWLSIDWEVLCNDKIGSFFGFPIRFIIFALKYREIWTERNMRGLSAR